MLTLVWIMWPLTMQCEWNRLTTEGTWQLPGAPYCAKLEEIELNGLQVEGLD